MLQNFVEGMQKTELLFWSQFLFEYLFKYLFPSSNLKQERDMLKEAN